MNNSEHIKPNRLINEKSPYLLQHAYNPVDWYPWGDEAFQKAKEEDKPVFLSIGYSTCHWCHVMEKESFEDFDVAALLNKDFVSIKVDREERPDLDQFYMTACQAMTGQGGWPLSIFMTADKKPFFAATYLPKYSRMGISGLVEFLPKLAEIWHQDRDRVEQSAYDVTEALRRHTEGGMGGQSIGVKGKLPEAEVLDQAYQSLKDSYDSEYGGFGGAPKFPAPHQLNFLLQYWKRTGSEKALNMAINTLKKMHRGGIFDQLGYGMHRYSVDRQWLVPHFEKMLYDQATTAEAALEAYRVSGDEEMADMARKIFSYVLKELTAAEGPFYSAEDADSEGEEGTFYVWERGEILELLGPEKGELVADYFGVTEAGNFEKGKSVLHRPHDRSAFCKEKGISEKELTEILEETRPILLQARAGRERPFLDDKFITAWNGMIIGVLARGAVLLGEKSYSEAADRAADFILQRMVSENGQLCRRYREGEVAIPAFLEDYAFLARGLLELNLATFDSRRLEQAVKLTGEMDRFLNRDEGRLKFSSAEENIAGLPLYVEAYDGAVPSGTAVAAETYLRLGRLNGDEDMIRKGELLIGAQAGVMKRFPNGHTAMLAVLDLALSPEKSRADTEE